jgi:hypothetical protein
LSAAYQRLHRTVDTLWCRVVVVGWIDAKKPITKPMHSNLLPFYDRFVSGFSNVNPPYGYWSELSKSDICVPRGSTAAQPNR